MELIYRLRVSIEMSAIRIAGAMPIHALRLLALRLARANVGHDVVVYHGLNVRNPRGLTIGDGCSIGDGASLDARGGLTIGKTVNLSTEVQIWTAQHDWASDQFESVTAPVTIGDRAWIGPRVIVLPGSSIGAGAVIGAGSVVKGTIPPNSLCAGSPAVPVRDRPAPSSYSLGTSRTKIWWW